MRQVIGLDANVRGGTRRRWSNEQRARGGAHHPGGESSHRGRTTEVVAVRAEREQIGTGTFDERAKLRGRRSLEHGDGDVNGYPRVELANEPAERAADALRVDAPETFHRVGAAGERRGH